MSNKVITTWLILLTAWVGFATWSDHDNLELRKKNTVYRNQKYKDIDARLESIEEYLNGPMREELNKIKKYLHEH